MARSPHAKPWPTRLAAGSALVLFLLGATVQVGWLANLPALIQIRPDLPPMTRNVAASFLLLGTGFLVLALRGPRWVAALCALPVLVVSAVSYAEIAFRLSFGINEILGPSYINVQLRSPGRMAPITAISLMVASVSMLAVSTILPIRSGLAISLNGAMVAAFGVVAMLYVNPSLAALHTGAGIAVTGFCMLALAWRSMPPGQATPSWLPLVTAAGVAALTAALLRALLQNGFRPSPLPSVVLAVGALAAPLLALTVYLAQRAHAQAAALRRSQAFLEEAQALSRTGSFCWRTATGEITCSRQLHRMLEIDEAVPVTPELLQLRLDQETLRELAEVAAQARRTGMDVDFERRLQQAGRPDRHFHLVAHAIRAKDGELEYFGAVQDVTSQRQSEAALGQARAELARVARMTSLGALTASIAHEVQQPLSAIIMNASTGLRMLDADPPDLGGVRETARRTLRDGNRAAEVISRLRTLFAKRPPTVEMLDLNHAVREVIALCASELQRERVQVQVDIAAEPLAVAGDRVQLQQVILNLILNATDAMRGMDGRPKQLAIRTVREGDEVLLSVRDNGTGFDPETAQKLFDAFYTTKPEGMGMGLSISRTIIERHNGRIWGSANSGPGATFTFTVPRAVTEELVDAGPPAAPAVQRAAGRTPSNV